ncbi:hypothetical protein TWF103_009411 [Orbilia oligospora]|nr:hypothetical protein TWF103_009411 [Orbilia oligospora]KAF3290445.1 hypothetical protein TWF132_007006 [Orbilia oligospora]
MPTLLAQDKFTGAPTMQRTSLIGLSVAGTALLVHEIVEECSWGRIKTKSSQGPDALVSAQQGSSAYHQS